MQIVHFHDIVGTYILVEERMIECLDSSTSAPTQWRTTHSPSWTGHTPTRAHTLFHPETDQLNTFILYLIQSKDMI